MAVPKKKKSKSRCGHNNSHSAIKPQVIAYTKDGNPHRSHIAVKMPDGSYCYNGRIVIPAKKKEKKSEERGKQ